jgi:hypothetical protein
MECWARTSRAHCCEIQWRTLSLRRRNLIYRNNLRHEYLQLIEKLSTGQRLHRRLCSRMTKLLYSSSPKKEKMFMLLCTMHSDGAASERLQEPEIVLFYCSTEGGVDCCGKLVRNYLKWKFGENKGVICELRDAGIKTNCVKYQNPVRPLHGKDLCPYCISWGKTSSLATLRRTTFM